MTTTSAHNVRLFAAVAGLGLCCGAASAATYSFTAISDNNAVNTAIGEAQLFVDVTDAGTNMGGAKLVSFLFRNTGPDPSVIANAYWDDDGNALLAIDSIDDGGMGVGFDVNGAPPDLPEGTNVSFSADHRVRADNPAPTNGVGPGEEVAIIFSLETGFMFMDVLDMLNEGDLRIGLHVISIGPTAGSESFVNNGMVVPLPSGAGLAAAGMGLIALRRRRR